MTQMNANLFNEIMEKVKSCIKSYELALEDNKYYLGLANGDRINIEFPKSHIPHLLGINPDVLKIDNIVRNDIPAYEILKKLSNGDITYYDIINKKSNFDFSKLISPFVDSKIDIFCNNIKVRTDDLYCIIKYDSERSYTNGEEKENSDYFIIRKQDSKYMVLGIIKNFNQSNYVPVTSRVFNSSDELSGFLKKVAANQEITYPHSFKIDNYDKEYHFKNIAFSESKLAYNKILKNIADKYKAIPSVCNDTLVILEKYLNNNQKSINNSSILRIIKENVLSKNIIDKEEVKQILDVEIIPEELELLIDSCNDLICSNEKSDISVGESYSNIQNENNNLRKSLDELKEELLEIKELVKTLQSDNDNLTEQNNSYSQKLKVLTDAYESIK